MAFYEAINLHFLLKILQYLKHNPLLLKKNKVWYKNYYFFIDNIE